MRAARGGELVAYQLGEALADTGEGVTEHLGVDAVAAFGEHPFIRLDLAADMADLEPGRDMRTIRPEPDRPCGGDAQGEVLQGVDRGQAGADRCDAEEFFPGNAHAASRSGDRVVSSSAMRAALSGMPS